MNLKNIYILSASDRFNYGDLLFPFISINELKKHGNYNFINVSTVKSNLSKIGALPTKGYNSLRKSKTTNNVLLIAGGEVLGANWSRLYSFIFPWYHFIFSHCKYKYYLEYITKWLTGNKQNPIPFIPLDQTISNKFDIVFHGVGGAGISRNYYKKEISEIFSKSKYLSLREKASFEDIAINLNIEKAKLTPDSAILMSDWYNFKPYISDENYIVFQVGRYKTGNELNVLKDELEKVSKRTTLSIYLLPIGNCPGHEDDIPLKWLHNNLNCPSKLIYPNSIWDIMKTIAHAKLFIGTSLHGVITAMSFNVPYMGINPSITKLKYYLKTWAPELLQEIIPINAISKHVYKHISIDPAILEDNSNFQKKMARESFFNIHQSIVS